MAKPAPNFLHVDSDAVVTEDHQLTVVDGQPMVPDKLYKVGYYCMCLPLASLICSSSQIGIYQLLLTGLNVIEPLFSWVMENITDIPEEEACMPAKEICIEVCMKDAWRKLLGYTDWDVCKPSPEELDREVSAAFEAIDANNDGFLERLEIERFFADQMGEQPATELLSRMISVLDSNNDGKIDPKEMAALAI